jgi:hypothetical protein
MRIMGYKVNNFRLYILFRSFVVGTYLAQSQIITSDLYTELFTTNNYTKQLIPICQNGGNVTVKFYSFEINENLDLLACYDNKKNYV